MSTHAPVQPRSPLPQSKVVGTLLAIMTTAWLAMMGWMATSIIELRDFASRGDRFTSTDAMELERRLMIRIDKSIPPRWVEERLDNLSSDLMEIKAGQNELRDQIEHLRHGDTP